MDSKIRILIVIRLLDFYGNLTDKIGLPIMLSSHARCTEPYIYAAASLRITQNYASVAICDLG